MTQRTGILSTVPGAARRVAKSSPADMLKSVTVCLAVLSTALVALMPLAAPQASAAGGHPGRLGVGSAAGHPVRGSAHANASRAKPQAFRHSFRLHGRVALHNPFTTKAARAFNRKVEHVNTRRVAILGKVVSQGRGLLIVQEIPWQTHGSSGARVAFSHTPSVPGAHTALIPVHILARTVVYSMGGMAGLRAGMAVFVGGAVVHHRFGAYIVSPVERSALVGAHLYRALSGRLVHLPRPLRTPGQKLPARHASPLDTNSLSFPGGFGGPSYNYNTDLGDIDIFDIGIFSVRLKSFSFLASLDGWTYNWPMDFTGSPNSSLVMTEQNTVNLNVIPQQGGSGSFTDTFSGGIGVDVGIGFHIYTVVGCGDVGLDSCDFYPTVHLGIGLLNKTQDPAPLATGTDLNVPSVECPSVGFNIPDTPISAADIGLCNTFIIHGANLSADVSATNATMTPTNLSFDGTNAQPFSLTPTSTPVGVTLSNFLWDPVMDYGLHPRIRVALQTVWTGPSVIIASGNEPMIADDATRQAAGFNCFDGPCDQPTSTSFSFPASKETTSITASAITQDYNDPVAVAATLTDGLGRPVSGKTLTFELNGNPAESCSGLTGASGSTLCFITPTDVPSTTPYTLAVSFAGDDTYFSSGASPAFTITKEESSVHYVGDTTQNYHDSTHLSATLVEDNSVLAISGQSLSLTLGSQSCTPVSGTNSSGTAGCDITLNQQSGQYDVGASFAGNAYYRPSSVTNTRGFTVTTEETTLTYTGAPLIANNRPATLSAILKEDGTTVPSPAGQTVVMTLGSSANKQTCQGLTLANGTVSCLIANVNQPLGNQPVTASFAGDAYYSASSDLSHQRLVFSYLPAGGSFAVGNNSLAVPTSLFWGSQWWSTNSLSGGAAPSAFKGFIQKFSPTGDPACGATWTTNPANSPPPPATVPSYMAVAVPSAVTSTGSTISGDIQKIVIVKTNPGYGPDPGQPGTGSIVATLCSR